MAGKEIPSKEIINRIKRSGLTIYDDLTNDADLYFSAVGLEKALNAALMGRSLDYPIRTRSKVIKSAVCQALGYPVPERFLKVRPRFTGQNFDTYVQKSNNLQIWNEEVSKDRRYVIIRVDDGLRVTAVRVVTGEVIMALDTTGTLTQKYQAAAREPVKKSMLVSPSDTIHVRTLIHQLPKTAQSGIRFPSLRFLSMNELYVRLKSLIGTSLKNPGSDQERNRGAVLHEVVEKALGYEARVDTGQFPDVSEQLLELKLQTSPTIDLGLVSPDSRDPIELIPQAHHCDVRYGVFYATLQKDFITLDSVVLTTGEDFFEYFRKFGGMEINRKIQIRLPQTFFGQSE